MAGRLLDAALMDFDDLEHNTTEIEVLPDRASYRLGARLASTSLITARR